MIGEGVHRDPCGVDPFGKYNILSYLPSIPSSAHVTDTRNRVLPLWIGPAMSDGDRLDKSGDRGALGYAIKKEDDCVVGCVGNDLARGPGFGTGPQNHPLGEAPALAGEVACRSVQGRSLISTGESSGHGFEPGRRGELGRCGGPLTLHDTEEICMSKTKLPLPTVIAERGRPRCYEIDNVHPGRWGEEMLLAAEATSRGDTVEKTTLVGG